MGNENFTNNLWRSEDEWRIRTNSEIQMLYGETDLVTEIEGSRSRWVAHAPRTEGRIPLKKVFLGKPQGCSGRGRQRKSLLDVVEEDLPSMGWRQEIEKYELILSSRVVEYWLVKYQITWTYHFYLEREKDYISFKIDQFSLGMNGIS